MQKYLLRRMLYGAFTLFGVSVIVFMVMRILPGEPLVAMFGSGLSLWYRFQLHQ